MKKLLGKILPVAVLALTVCMSIAMLAACSKPDVVFTGTRDIMGLETNCTLTLKDGGTCTYDVVIDSEMETAKQIASALCKTGTWEMKDGNYVVTLGEGATATTLTSTNADGIYTIEYGMPGRDGVFNVTLKTSK